jgi:hypothetical protein
MLRAQDRPRPQVWLFVIALPIATNGVGDLLTLSPEDSIRSCDQMCIFNFILNEDDGQVQAVNDTKV